jgi:hypothetical protein
MSDEEKKEVVKPLRCPCTPRFRPPDFVAVSCFLSNAIPLYFCLGVDPSFLSAALRLVGQRERVRWGVTSHLHTSRQDFPSPLDTLACCESGIAFSWK